MTKKLTELGERNNEAQIDMLTDEQRYAWYLQIKATFPMLKEMGMSDKVEQAILDYERRHGIV